MVEATLHFWSHIRRPYNGTTAMNRRHVKALQFAMTLPLIMAGTVRAADQPTPTGRFDLAQAQPAEDPAVRKRREEEQKRRQQQQRPPQQQQPQQQRPAQQAPQQQQRPASQEGPRRERPSQPPQQQQVQPQVPKQFVPPPVRQVAPPLPPLVATPRAAPAPAPSAQPATPFIRPSSPEGQRAAPSTGGPSPFARSQGGSPPPVRLDQVQRSRETRIEAGGRRTVVQENNRFIIRQDNRVFVRHDEADRFRRLQNARTVSISGGGSQTFHTRPDGFRVITETDRNGGLVRRYRRGPDGREFNIIDNRRFWRNAAIGVGVGAVTAAIILNLRRPVVTIPRHAYIVDYARASDDDLYETLNAPPVENLDRAYSLEEVRYNLPLRERMRSIDLDDITFGSGDIDVSPDQHRKLERLARVIERVLRSNPDEVFLIEGHTDAVGDDVDNLSLSDRRAQSVAQILSEEFGVPPENLVTQGYGEQFLKIESREPERLNRRVTVRRVTPLLGDQ